MPLFAWMGLIYFSSSQSYDDQTIQPVLSGVNLDFVYTLFSWVSFTYGDSVVSLETRSPASFVEFFIRKGAHVVVFGVLGILAFRLFNLFCAYAKTVCLSMLIVAGYSIFDEFRQSLHPGRSGMIEDVVLNSFGGVIGISISLLFISYRKKQIKMKKTLVL